MGILSPYHRPSRRLGQNFLSDIGIASSIVAAADLHREDVVLEPGAGRGALTRLLQNEAGRVIAVEKDAYLASYLREVFGNKSSVQVIHGDVLKTHLPFYNKVVGTPPYYLSSKLILFLAGSTFERACLVLQREFGERLIAREGTPDYGRLSVAAQLAFNVVPLMNIPRRAFNPVPKVDSLLLSITPKISSTHVDRALFDDMVRGIFTQKRRLIRGALAHYLELRFGKSEAGQLIKELRLPETRVYQLSVSQLESLATELKRALEAR